MTEPLFQALFEQAERRPLTVSELNAEVRIALERGFSSVWVEGEIVSFAAASSGHWYFNLNDGDSQIRAVCFRGSNFRIRFRPQNGLCVRVRGRLGIYEPRGELQLIVDSLEPAGEGALRAAFEQIKAKLEAEGLFDTALKRPIPFFPRRIGIVTSPTGAAYHDIHNVLSRRARSVSLLLIPTQVQGEGAADCIRRAISDANKYNSSLDLCDRIDVLIVGRGGGSAEDLWAFNDEALARAIRKSEIPVISAVGHEIDWSICDWVSDLRAATPSSAAELVAQREDEILAAFEARAGELERMIDLKMLECANAVDRAGETIERCMVTRLDKAVHAFGSTAAKLSPTTLIRRTEELQTRIEIGEKRRSTAISNYLHRQSECLRLQVAKLDALSPLGVLTRGYSIVQTADGSVLRDPKEVKHGDKLSIRVERGKLDAKVLAS